MSTVNSPVSIVEYFVAQNSILAFVTRLEFASPEIVEVALQPDLLRRSIAHHITGHAGEELEQLDWAAWSQLLSPLVEPISLYVPAGEQILFVPHDVLHQIPIHALPIEGAPLIDRNPICYAPNASVVTYCRSRRTGRRERALVLGDSLRDLPFARFEAQLVADLLGCHPLLGTQVTREALTHKASNADGAIDILHYAGHSFFDADSPMTSGICLACDGGGEETLDALTADDILQLKLQADLITLSGCASGVSGRSRGDELFGMVRAWLYAGAASVVVSLWPVDDISTAILMEQFYRHLLDDTGGFRMSKADALRRAQIFVRKMTMSDVEAYCANHLSSTYQDSRSDEPTALTGLTLALQARVGAVSDLYDCALRATDPPKAGEVLERLRRQLRHLQGAATEEHQRSSQYPFSSPFYWAPFILIGDHR